VKQTGFDPGQAQLAPHQRVQVTPTAPPGSDTAAGAVTGAVVGSMLSSRHDSGFGMVFGAITGAMLGAASDEERQRQAAQLQQQYDAKEAQRYAQLEKQSRDYQRAMTACLEGRGYTVR
jgi:outer membrane lipoprotein SlyB